MLQTFDALLTLGGIPRFDLSQGTSGALFGATSVGGNDGTSSIFKLNPDGTGFTILLGFDFFLFHFPPFPQQPIAYEANPSGGVIQGTDGTLYGTATAKISGTGIPGGILFRVNADGTDFTVLKEFGNTLSSPQGGLIQGPDGALYGTTFESVFRLNPDGTDFTVLQNFDYDTTGSGPLAALIQGADGALYGTTSSGGTGGYGTVFKLNLDGTSFSVLMTFDESTTGATALKVTPGVP